MANFTDILLITTSKVKIDIFAHKYITADCIISTLYNISYYRMLPKYVYVLCALCLTKKPPMVYDITISLLGIFLIIYLRRI